MYVCMHACVSVCGTLMHPALDIYWTKYGCRNVLQFANTSQAISRFSWLNMADLQGPSLPPSTGPDVTWRQRWSPKRRPFTTNCHFREDIDINRCENPGRTPPGSSLVQLRPGTTCSFWNCCWNLQLTLFPFLSNFTHWVREVFMSSFNQSTKLSNWDADL
jgi:hypothetical protein